MCASMCALCAVTCVLTYIYVLYKTVVLPCKPWGVWLWNDALLDEQNISLLNQVGQD